MKPPKCAQLSTEPPAKPTITAEKAGEGLRGRGCWWNQDGVRGPAGYKGSMKGRGTEGLSVRRESVVKE